MIDGVSITNLQKISDDRGMVMHMLRNDSPIFREFGEIYFSTVNPGAVKAWHFHKEMTLNYAVPSGNIKLVLYDERPLSPTLGKLQEIFVGVDNYCLVTIPPKIWSGFMGISPEVAIIANCASIPHCSNEIERRTEDDIKVPYSWKT